ncbi:MAG: hypothetical protein Q9180_003278 [Flavoplaca navasiana]
MQYSILLLVATLVGSTLTAPITQDAKEAAVINSRFVKYENKPRNAVAEEKKALINSRFVTYENQPRDLEAEKDYAVINSRFVKYENKPRDMTSKAE